jgi:hypothetical protein
MQSELVNSKTYPEAIFENMLGLAEELEEASFHSAALEVRALAERGPDRIPFGYFWQHVAEHSGKVVNSGFVRDAGSKMRQDALQSPERPLSGMPGFLERITPLYA